MTNGVTNVELILASQSPRRKYLLEQAGLRFKVIPSPFDEAAVPLDAPDPYVRALAEGKAHDVARRYPEAWVIGADTIVASGSRLLGKPGSTEEARRMLARLPCDVPCPLPSALVPAHNAPLSRTYRCLSSTYWTLPHPGMFS